MYADYLEYIPNTSIKNIDLDKKIVTTAFDEIEFEEAAFYPHVRGAKILERCGIAKDAKNMLEGDINPLTYEVNGHSNMFISGDSRPMGFSKSGNTSNSEGHFVAKLVAAKVNGKKINKWESPTTTCFSVVSTKPQKAIYIYSEYAYNAKDKTFAFSDTTASEDWQSEVGDINGRSVYDWAGALFYKIFTRLYSIA